jgi:RimJ/RimL family protein N-acetyltransferase
MKTFETARLLMRPLQPDDETLYCACYTDPVLMQHIGEPFSREAALKSFNAALKAAAVLPIERYTWMMQEKESGARVGLLAIIFQKTEAEPVNAELGNMMLRAFQNREFTVEALGKLVDIAFSTLPLAEVFACHRTRNSPVNRVMKKLGFFPEETRSGDVVENRWVLSRSNWQASRKNPI